MKIELTKKLLAEKINNKVVEALLLERKFNIFDKRIEFLLCNIENDKLQQLLKESFFDRKFADVDKELQNWKDSKKGKTFIKVFNSILPGADINKIHPKENPVAWNAFRLASDVVDGKMSIDDAKQELDRVENNKKTSSLPNVKSEPEKTDKTLTKEIPPADQENLAPVVKQKERPDILSPEIKKFLKQINFQNFFSSIIEKFLKDQTDETKEIVLDHYREIFGNFILNESISFSHLKKLIESVVQQNATKSNSLVEIILKNYIIVEFSQENLLEGILNSKGIFPGCKLQFPKTKHKQYARMYLPLGFKTNFLKENILIVGGGTLFRPLRNKTNEIPLHNDEQYQVLSLEESEWPIETEQAVINALRSGKADQAGQLSSFFEKYNEDFQFNYENFGTSSPNDGGSPQEQDVSKEMPTAEYSQEDIKKLSDKFTNQQTKKEIPQNNIKAPFNKPSQDEDENLPIAQEVFPLKKQKLPIEIIPRVSNEIFKYAIEKTKLLTDKASKEKIVSWIKEKFELDQELLASLAPAKRQRKEKTAPPEVVASQDSIPTDAQEPQTTTTEPEEVAPFEPEMNQEPEQIIPAQASPVATQKLKKNKTVPAPIEQPDEMSFGRKMAVKKLESAISNMKAKLNSLKPNEKELAKSISDQIAEKEKELNNLHNRTKIPTPTSGPNNAVANIAAKTKNQQAPSPEKEQTELPPVVQTNNSANNLEKDVEKVFAESFSKIKPGEYFMYNILKDHKRNVLSVVKQFLDRPEQQAINEARVPNKLKATSRGLHGEERDKVKQYLTVLQKKIENVFAQIFGKDALNLSFEYRKYSNQPSGMNISVKDALTFALEKTIEGVHDTFYKPSPTPIQHAKKAGIDPNLDINQLIKAFAAITKFQGTNPENDYDIKGLADYYKKYG